MSFVHLHVHSQFTILDGTFSPTELVARARELGQSSIALTDRANLYGAVEFFKACKEAQIHPVLGVELAVDRKSVV